MYKIKSSVLSPILRSVESYGDTWQLTEEQKQIYKDYTKARQEGKYKIIQDEYKF